MRSMAAPPPDDQAVQWRVLKSLLPWLWPHGRADLKRRVVFALIALVAAKGIAVVSPFFYKAAVDGLGGSETGLWGLPDFALVPIFMVIAYGVARILTIGLGQLRDGLFAKVGNYAQAEIAVSTFAHMHSLSLAFHLERRTGGLARVIDRGIKGIDFLLRFSLFNVIPTLLEIVMVTVIFWVNFGPVFAAITLVTVGSYIWFTFSVTEWRVTIRRHMNDSDTEANVKAVDSLLNFETVKYFSNEGHETGRYRKSMMRYAVASERSQTSLSWLNTGQVVVTSIGLIVLMGLSAKGVADGRYTVGDFVMVNAFLIQLYQPLGFLGTVYREIKQALTDMETLFGMMAVAPGIDDDPDAKPLSCSGGEIRFEEVDFGYGADRQILKNVSFTVPAGKTVAIVGPSGAGKSTISRLLYRFYDVWSGRIVIDGQDVRAVTQQSLRAQIGIVPQDTVLFNDTIGYNIAYGRPGASDEDIREAARLAQIDRFVEGLAERYDTRVGERGLKLSGGEKQRVAIARTILKNPPILLLDEATSALDTQTERDIQAALKEISKDRTTLIIAHRLSTIVEADEILVLRAGEIVERGTHHDLVEQSGLYADMWAKQQAQMEEAGGDVQTA